MREKKCTFIVDEQAIQLAYFDARLKDKAGHCGRAFQLRHEHRFEGLLPGVRALAPALFETLRIQWHSYVGHGRSSQACCVNFLMPLADKPDLLARWVSALLDVPPPTMLAIEQEAAGPLRYVAFEYTGPGGIDYLGEAEGGVPQRGAHATASDAAIGFIDNDGLRRLLLIEWKYSEQYRGHRLSEDRSGKRIVRYADKTFAPNGPVRDDLGLALLDFFHEPFYQLVRQQMLAWQIERTGAFDKVQVLHLSPSGNRALHAMTAPALTTIDGVAQDDAFDAYRRCLADPNAFIGETIERAFAPFATWPEATWYADLRARYPSLCLQPSGAAA